MMTYFSRVFSSETNKAWLHPVSRPWSRSGREDQQRGADQEPIRQGARPTCFGMSPRDVRLGAEQGAKAHMLLGSGGRAQDLDQQRTKQARELEESNNDGKNRERVYM